MTFEIIHRFANDAVVSTHRTREAAEAKLQKMVRSFRKAHPSTFPTRAIFPYNIREKEAA